MQCTYCNDDSNTELLETLGDFETWECLTCGKTFDVDLKDNEPTENTNCLEGWKCPKCEQSETFYVDVITSQTVLMSDDGHEDEGNVEEHERGIDSHTSCHCGYKGYAGLFMAEFVEITPKMKKIYMDNHGEKCPFCLSEQIERSHAGDFGTNTNQKMRCNDCDRSWYDLYTLVDIEI